MTVVSKAAKRGGGGQGETSPGPPTCYGFLNLSKALSMISWGPPGTYNFATGLVTSPDSPGTESE